MKHISAEEFIHYCNIDEINSQSKQNCNKSLNSSTRSDMTHGVHEKDFVRTSNNLEAYIQWFNRLTNFITTEIVKHLKRDTRVQIINYFIEVACECFQVGNFNSLMAIIGNCTKLSSTQDLVSLNFLRILSEFEHEQHFEAEENGIALFDDGSIDSV